MDGRNRYNLRNQPPPPFYHQDYFWDRSQDRENRYAQDRSAYHHPDQYYDNYARQNNPNYGRNQWKNSRGGGKKSGNKLNGGASNVSPNVEDVIRRTVDVPESNKNNPPQPSDKITKDNLVDASPDQELENLSKDDLIRLVKIQGLKIDSRNVTGWDIGDLNLNTSTGHNTSVEVDPTSISDTPIRKVVGTAYFTPNPNSSNPIPHELTGDITVREIDKSGNVDSTSSSNTDAPNPINEMSGSSQNPDTFDGNFITTDRCSTGDFSTDSDIENTLGLTNDQLHAICLKVTKELHRSKQGDKQASEHANLTSKIDEAIVNQAAKTGRDTSLSAMTTNLNYVSTPHVRRSDVNGRKVNFTDDTYTTLNNPSVGQNLRVGSHQPFSSTPAIATSQSHDGVTEELVTKIVRNILPQFTGSNRPNTNMTEPALNPYASNFYPPTEATTNGNSQESHAIASSSNRTYNVSGPNNVPLTITLNETTKPCVAMNMQDMGPNIFSGRKEHYPDFKRLFLTMTESYSPATRLLKLKNHLDSMSNMYIAYIDIDDPSAFEETWNVLDKLHMYDQRQPGYNLSQLLTVLSRPKCRNVNDLKELYSFIKLHYAKVSKAGPKYAQQAEAICHGLSSRLYGWSRRKVNELMQNKDENSPGIMRILEYIQKHIDNEVADELSEMCANAISDPNTHSHFRQSMPQNSHNTPQYQTHSSNYTPNYRHPRSQFRDYNRDYNYRSNSREHTRNEHYNRPPTRQFRSPRRTENYSRSPNRPPQHREYSVSPTGSPHRGQYYKPSQYSDYVQKGSDPKWASQPYTHSRSRSKSPIKESATFKIHVDADGKPQDSVGRRDFKPTRGRSPTPIRNDRSPNRFDRSKGKFKCSFCKNSEHYTLNCNKITSDTALSHARKERLCFRCLLPFHTADICPHPHCCTSTACGNLQSLPPHAPLLCEALCKVHRK